MTNRPYLQLAALIARFFVLSMSIGAIVLGVALLIVAIVR
jgi:hypothetical protein